MFLYQMFSRTGVLTIPYLLERKLGLEHIPIVVLYDNVLKNTQW